MPMSERLGNVWRRIRVISLRAGVLVLLFYVTSLYTRDWRPLVPHPEQQVVSRPRALAYAVPADPGETAARLEPDTTGALPRMAERIARGPAAGRVTRQSASAVSRSQAQAVAPRSRGQHKPNKQADVAAPATTTSSVTDQRPSQPDASAQSQPEEPVQFRLAERSN
jgi:hypothetical protein